MQKKLALNRARHTHRDDQQIHSLGTARNYTQALTRLTQWLQRHQLNDLKHLDQSHCFNLSGMARPKRWAKNTGSRTPGDSITFRY